MKAIGMLLATLGIILILGYVALVMYLWIKTAIDADRFPFFWWPRSLKTALLLLALSVSGIALAVAGFEIIT